MRLLSVQAGYQKARQKPLRNVLQMTLSTFKGATSPISLNEGVVDVGLPTSAGERLEISCDYK